MSSTWLCAFCNRAQGKKVNPYFKGDPEIQPPIVKKIYEIIKQDVEFGNLKIPNACRKAVETKSLAEFNATRPKYHVACYVRLLKKSGLAEAKVGATSASTEEFPDTDTSTDEMSDASETSICSPPVKLQRVLITSPSRENAYGKTFVQQPGTSRQRFSLGSCVLCQQSDSEERVLHRAKEQLIDTATEILRSSRRYDEVNIMETLRERNDPVYWHSRCRSALWNEWRRQEKSKVLTEEDQWIKMLFKKILEFIQAEQSVSYINML